VDEDALAEELIAAEPIRPRVTEQRITTEPIRLTLITGLDRKRYAPKRGPKPPPGPAEQLAKPPPPSDAETFDNELADLDRMVDVMAWLTNRGQLDEDERTILAGRVADYS